MNSILRSLAGGVICLGLAACGLFLEKPPSDLRFLSAEIVEFGDRPDHHPAHPDQPKILQDRVSPEIRIGFTTRTDIPISYRRYSVFATVFFCGQDQSLWPNGIGQDSAVYQESVTPDAPSGVPGTSGPRASRARNDIKTFYVYFSVRRDILDESSLDPDIERVVGQFYDMEREPVDLCLQLDISDQLLGGNRSTPVVVPRQAIEDAIRRYHQAGH